MLSRHQIYRLKNKEKISIYEKEYREINRDKKQKYDSLRYSENKSDLREQNKSYRTTSKDKVNAKNARRRVSSKNAIPIWADLTEIKKVYAEAKQLRETGQDVHVDHIIPLQSDFVTGLHVSENLRIILAYDNISKHNKYWPDMWTEV